MIFKLTLLFACIAAVSLWAWLIHSATQHTAKSELDSPDAEVTQGQYFRTIVSPHQQHTERLAAFRQACDKDFEDAEKLRLVSNKASVKKRANKPLSLVPITERVSPGTTAMSSIPLRTRM